MSTADSLSAENPLAVVCRGAVCSVIPHQHNNFRPYALRHPVLAFLNAFILAATLGGTIILSLAPETARVSTIASSVLLQLTNQERQKNGLPALKTNSSLQRAAALKAEDMLRHDYFEHTSPKGISPWAWFDAARYSYLYAGENLAIDFTTSETVVAAWMASPGHRRNILSDRYAEIGLAVVSGEFEGRTTTIVVQHFGRAEGSAVPGAAPASKVAATKPKPTVARAPSPAPAAVSVPAPVILSPEHGTTLYGETVRVQGTAPAGSTVDVKFNDVTVSSVPASGDTFVSDVPLPAARNEKVKLSAVAHVGVLASASSAPREVSLAEAPPALATSDVMILPDPAGIPESAVAVIRAPEEVRGMTLTLPNREALPLERSGAFFVAHLPEVPTVPLRLLATTKQGNTHPLEVSLPSFFTARNPAPRESFVRISGTILALRPWLLALLVTLLLLLGANVFIHAQLHRLIHADLAVHAALVLLLGTGLMIFT